MKLQNLIAECLGTCLLLATVVGSGIMAETLSGGNVAIALLGNTLATGAMLVVLISVFGPLSGAHFNPVVSLAMALEQKLPRSELLPYIVAQTLGAIIGVIIAHAMFDQQLVQFSERQRWGTGQWISEAVATFGLLLTIFGALHHKSQNIPMLVGLYITSAYWFTASTSFANPAVTIARSFTNTFSGIEIGSVLPFIAAQIVGTLVAVFVSQQLFKAD